MNLAYVDALWWSAPTGRLLAGTRFRERAIGALSWPEQTIVWEHTFDRESAVLCWDVEGSVLMLDGDGLLLRRFDHLTGEEVARASLPGGRRVSRFDRATSFGAQGYGILTESAYLEFDSSDALSHVVDLSHLPPAFAFLSRGAERRAAAPEDPWRALVYQSGFALVHVDGEERATVVNTQGHRTFGQKPFDPVPNPIDPLAKFTLVDVDSPESLGTIEFPTFAVGAHGWLEPTLLLFGGPFSGTVLGFDLERGGVVAHHSEHFRAHNIQPIVRAVAPDRLIVQGARREHAELRVEPAADRSHPYRLFVRPVRLGSCFAYAEAHGGYVTATGFLGERTLEPASCSTPEQALPWLPPESPAMPKIGVEALDLADGS